MIRFCTLFSGSSGNSTYISGGDGGILIDAGVNCKTLVSKLRQINVEPDTIKALFITHEHGDHIAGIRVFAGRYGIPVYSTAGTLAQIEQRHASDERTRLTVLPEGGVDFTDMRVTSFHISHDVADPVGYRIDFGGKVIATATDTGCITPEEKAAFTGADLVLIESNHDLDMLKNGFYPYELKQRIRSKTGHLSNDDCAAFLPYLLENGTTRFVLGHLSRDNNTPYAAHSASMAALLGAGAKADVDFELTVAEPESTKTRCICL